MKVSTGKWTNYYRPTALRCKFDVGNGRTLCEARSATWRLGTCTYRSFVLKQRRTTENLDRFGRSHNLQTSSHALQFTSSTVRPSQVLCIIMITFTDLCYIRFRASTFGEQRIILDECAKLLYIVSMFEWLLMIFGLITGFIGNLQLVITSNTNSSWICTVYNSLWKSLSLLSLQCLPSVTPSNSGRSSSSGFPNCPRASATAFLS
jgi:hypothetical protein